MSMTTAERTQLMGRIASDREFRRLVQSSPRKAAGELGIALSESEENQILAGMREIRNVIERTSQLMSDARAAPFVFMVLITHDDGGADEDEEAPVDVPGSGNHVPGIQ